MTRSRILWGLALAILVSLAGFGGWMLSLPPAPVRVRTASIPPSEARAMIASLKPVRRSRPLVAVIGINDATETTDYLMPTGILRRAGVADVMMLSTRPGPVRLYPALTVLPDADIARFDSAHPEGADYVIVPAMSRDDDPAVLAWLNAQAGKGAIIVAVCAGAKVVGAAGLLDGRRATTHWYYLDELLERNPTIRYVPDRRMVIDGKVATTTGITASMPMMLTLVEAIGGRAKAEAIARALGLAGWDAGHASAAFKMTRPFAATVIANRMAFWNREKLGLPLETGMDEVGLALAADAWSRTYRSGVVSVAPSSGAELTANSVRIVPDLAGFGWPSGVASAAPSTGAVVTANGVRIVPDLAVPGWPEKRLRASALQGPPARVLDSTLDSIGVRYGRRTADLVAMQLEYSR